MTNQKIRETIRGLQITRSEILMSIATHNADKTLQQQQASIKHQNAYFDEQVRILLFCLKPDTCNGLKNQLLNLNGYL